MVQQQSPFKGDTLRGKASARQALRSRFLHEMALTRYSNAQVAFITGGGSGIGYEIARQLGETDDFADCVAAAQGPSCYSNSICFCLLHESVTRAALAGLHGAKIAVMGRRQNVISEAADKLKSEKIDAFGVQVVII